MLLDPSAVDAGTRLIRYDSVDSTNAEALRLARGGERGPLWIVAAEQTAGRGRRGRAWVSAAGNLYASLLLNDPAPAEHRAQMSFVAVLAAHDAVTALAPTLGGRLAIKWPNDLLLDGKKCAGVLVESDSEAAGAVIVGIGINCATHPDRAEHPVTDLAAEGFTVTPSALFTALSAATQRRLEQWDRGAGFAAIREAWLARAAGRGEPLVARLIGRELRGCFETVDDAGRLVLRLADGRCELVAAADVFAPARPEIA